MKIIKTDAIVILVARVEIGRIITQNDNPLSIVVDNYEEFSFTIQSALAKKLSAGDSVAIVFSPDERIAKARSVFYLKTLGEKPGEKPKLIIGENTIWQKYMIDCLAENSDCLK